MTKSSQEREGEVKRLVIIATLILAICLSWLFLSACSKQPVFEQQNELSKKKDTVPYFHSIPIVLDTNFQDLSPSIPIIWLDFNGDTSNNVFGYIKSDDAGLTQDQKEEVIDSVRSFFRRFNCITTGNKAVYDNAHYRLKVIITNTYQWIYKYYPNGATGVAYIGSYAWHDDTPAYVFSPACSYTPSTIAFYCAHEIGHCLGLNHQVTWRDNCNTYDYNIGDGKKSPFMSVATTEEWSWWDGTTDGGCTTDQNDVDIINYYLTK